MPSISRRAWPCSASSPSTPPSCGGSDAMVVAVIYIAATAAVAVYMLAALLRPEDF